MKIFFKSVTTSSKEKIMKDFNFIFLVANGVFIIQKNVQFSEKRI